MQQLMYAKIPDYHFTKSLQKELLNLDVNGTLNPEPIRMLLPLEMSAVLLIAFNKRTDTLFTVAYIEQLSWPWQQLKDSAV